MGDPTVDKLVKALATATPLRLEFGIAFTANGSISTVHIYESSGGQWKKVIPYFLVPPTEGGTRADQLRQLADMIDTYEPESEPEPDPSLLAGWATAQPAKKFHYFKAGAEVTVCGGYNRSLARLGLKQTGDFSYGARCVACERGRGRG